MKERFATIGTLVCLTILIALLLVYALAIFPGTEAIRWFFATSAVVVSRLDAPAWMQAIGSLAAVFGAAGGIWWQVRRQAHLQKIAKIEDEVRLLKIVGMFVFDARAKLREMEERVMPHRRLDWTSIEAPVASIRAVPVDRYPEEGAAFAVASALLSYNFMRDDYARLGTSEGTLEEAAAINRSRSQTVVSFFQAEQAIDLALRSRGSQLVTMQVLFEHGVLIRSLTLDPI
jgi:hypothetical protein